MIFDYQGFTQSEILRYIQWEETQDFHEELPDCHRIEEYNLSLPRRYRYNVLGNLRNVAQAYLEHINRSRLGGLMATGQYTKLSRDARFAGYYGQSPRTSFNSEDERFVYESWFLKGQALNTSLRS